MIKKQELLAASILASIMLPAAAFGQLTINTDQIQPGVIDRQIEEIDIPENMRLDAEVPPPLEDAPRLADVADGDKIVANLSAVKFSGAHMIDNATLQAVASPYVGHPITKAELAQLKFDVTSAFYDRGFILVKVVTPPQDLSDGILEISVYEAKVGNIHVEDRQKLLQPYVVRGITSQVNQGSVFDERSVESMISDINDLKDIEATLSLQPGQEFSTTDLNVEIRDANESVNRFTLDNYGSSLTGKGIAAVHLEKSNLFNLGETFGLNLRGSNGDLWSIGTRAEAPIGFRNVIAEFSYLHSQNNIGDRLAALDAEGETDRLGLALSSKVINTRNVKVTVRGGVEGRLHESFLSNTTDTKDDIRQFYVESTYLQRGVSSVWYASGRITRGVDSLGANKEGDVSATRITADPEAWHFEPVLFANIRPVDDGTLKLLLTGQYSTNVVLSSDLFVLGGYGSVRGFEPAQESGESGYQFSAQYDHELPYTSNSVWRMRAGPFVEGGAVYNRIPGSVEDTHLYSAGLGFEAVGDLVPAGETKFRIDWARTLGSYDSAEVDSNTVYFGLSQNF